jgi:hypothetical protein
MPILRRVLGTARHSPAKLPEFKSFDLTVTFADKPADGPKKWDVLSPSRLPHTGFGAMARQFIACDHHPTPAVRSAR